jgi:hypothetical protein
MQDNYQHGGGSNRAGDHEGNLIGWLVFTDETRSAVRVVDRNGEPAAAGLPCWVCLLVVTMIATRSRG